MHPFSICIIVIESHGKKQALQPTRSMLGVKYPFILLLFYSLHSPQNSLSAIHLHIRSNLQCPINLPMWDVGANWSTRSKPSWSQGEHTNFTGQLQGSGLNLGCWNCEAATQLPVPPIMCQKLPIFQV